VIRGPLTNKVVADAQRIGERLPTRRARACACPVRRIIDSCLAAEAPAGSVARLPRCATISGYAARDGCRSILAPSASGRPKHANASVRHERGRARRIRQIAAVAVTPTAATAVITTAPPVISLHKIYGTYVAAEAASWTDGPDYPHTEPMEVVQPDAFIPAAGTASTSTSYRLQPSGGVNPHPDGWERYHWLMHDD
jgi:hypothetical protein